MKKRYHLFILLCFSFSKVICQNHDIPGVEIGLYGGVAIPLGEFANKEMYDWDSHCGCAKTAGSIGIRGKIHIDRNFFAVFGIQKAWNVYDPAPITRALHLEFDAPFSTESDSWKSKILQLGGGYYIYLNKNWHLFLQGTALVNDFETYFFSNTITRW